MPFKPRFRFLYIFLLFLSVGLMMMAAAAFDSKTGGQTAEQGLPGERVKGLLQFLYFVVFIYFSLNYYYHFIRNYRKIGAHLQFTLAMLAAGYTWHLLLYYFLPGAMPDSAIGQTYVFCTFMQSGLPMLLLSFFIAYVVNMQEALKQRRILEAQKMQLEIEKAQANFNFLKAQINPHFLHNTLNFFYAKSLPHSAELSEGILTLSDIMRYALDQGNRQEGKTLLSDEVEHVRNVIKINQLRYGDELALQLEVQGSTDGLTIVPFVLITLVENAFKHGDWKDRAHPIDVRLHIEGRKLRFWCKNKKKTGPKPPSTGIGLDNIKKRLALSYKERFELSIRDEADFFMVELTIEEL